jgi:hypothetical protein
MAKHQLSRFVYLALPADIHPGPFQPEVEAADA